METEFVYLTKQYGEYPVGRTVPLTPKEAAEVREQKAGLILDSSQYNKHQQRIEAALNRFKSTEKKIIESKDPRDTEEVKKYVVKEAFAELEKEVAEVETEWAEYREKLKEEARVLTATATVRISESDKAMAEQLANRYRLYLAQSIDKHRQQTLVDLFAKDIDLLPDGAKAAIQTHLTSFSSVLTDGVRLNSAYSSALAFEDPAIHASKAVDTLIADPTFKFRQFKTVRSMSKPPNEVKEFKARYRGVR